MRWDACCGRSRPAWPDVAGEDPWLTAQRELMEETGYRARDWRLLADYYSSPGFSTERLRIFLARDLEAVPAAERHFVPRDEEAHLLLGWLPLDEAVGKVFAGELHNGPAILAIMAGYAARLQRGLTASPGRCSRGAMRLSVWKDHP